MPQPLQPDDSSPEPGDRPGERPGDRPPWLEYAPPEPRQRSEQPVADYILGALGAIVLGFVLLAVGNSLVYVLLMVALPATMLLFKPSRMYGVGWLTVLATVSLAFFIICGR